MGFIFKLLVIGLSIAQVLSQGQGARLYAGGDSPVGKASAFSASSKVYETIIEPMCVSKTQTTNLDHPTGQSMENFIALVEKLELYLEEESRKGNQLMSQNLGAENTAKLLMRRFRYDGYDMNSGQSNQNDRDRQFADVNDAFIFKQGDNPPTGSDSDYVFPDTSAHFTPTELCSLFYMLSHNIYNLKDGPRQSYSAIFRGKRQANYNRGQQQPYNPNQRQTGNQNQRQYPQNSWQNAPIAPIHGNTGAVRSDYLPRNRTVHPIREEGVVSFRSHKTEAIAVARVLTGIIAGLSRDIKTNFKDVLPLVKPIANVPTELDKQIDPIIAMTLADLWANAKSGTTNDETSFANYYFNVEGQWSSTSCTTHYGLTQISEAQYEKGKNYIKATKAEIRGGIDGYLIGKSLKDANIQTTGNSRLSLSTILRSFYSKPKSTKANTFSISYCDRNTQINPSALNEAAQGYALLQQLAFKAKSQALLGQFTTALTSAQQIENNGYNDYCNRPGTTYDETAPCETPSDVLFIIDGSTTDRLQQSADIVAQIAGNLNNIRYEGGTVSIFLNSAGRNQINGEIQLPVGDWPLVAAAFNSTNTGCAQCRIDDFNRTGAPAVANMGKYFKYLNQTLFNYEWWNPRTNNSAVPGKSAVLIELGGVQAGQPDSGQDRNDYNYFKDQLRYRHRDVRYLAISQNQDLFKDILRDETDKESAGNVLQLGPNIAKKICENPATFQYNRCHDKRSDNVVYEGFITPGYKQNWAMYPEFFLKSFDIRFTFKPEDGDIRVCFDRKFPPKNTDAWHCRELKMGTEEYFDISNPCKGDSFSSCDPFYFTVWGKDRTGGIGAQCTDPRCLNLDQIKFTVTHRGVQCSSSNHLLPSNAFKFITLFVILYLFLSK